MTSIEQRYHAYKEAVAGSSPAAPTIKDQARGGMVALDLNLPDEDALIALQQRLRSGDCEVTDIVDHGSVHSVYFSDPNGIALEASWWVFDATGRAADYGDDRFFAAPKPVPALNELRATGSLTPYQAPDSRRPSPSWQRGPVHLAQRDP